MWVFLILAAIAALACLGLFQAIRLAREVGFSCSEVGLPACFFVAVLCAILCFAVASVVPPCIPPRHVRSPFNELQHLGLMMRLYVRDHDGRYPLTLEALYPDYLDTLDLLEWPTQRLVYVPPGVSEDMLRDDIVAYYWPPEKGGVVVLYASGRVEFVAVAPNGDLVNPRNGKVVRRAGDLATEDS